MLFWWTSINFPQKFHILKYFWLRRRYRGPKNHWVCKYDLSKYLPTWSNFQDAYFVSHIGKNQSKWVERISFHQDWQNAQVDKNISSTFFLWRTLKTAFLKTMYCWSMINFLNLKTPKQNTDLEYVLKLGKRRLEIFGRGFIKWHSILYS